MLSESTSWARTVMGRRQVLRLAGGALAGKRFSKARRCYPRTKGDLLTLFLRYVSNLKSSSGTPSIPPILPSLLLPSLLVCLPTQC